ATLFSDLESMTFDLDKASVPEARRQLQDLTFGLVEQLQTLEKRLEGAAGVLEGPGQMTTCKSLLGAGKRRHPVGRVHFRPSQSNQSGRERRKQMTQPAPSPSLSKDLAAQARKTGWQEPSWTDA
uniref:Uncharacterized protein n=1 Tax=Naja naja TaxID=35670 RepID=A0A8C6XGW4_NAJNA